MRRVALALVMVAVVGLPAEAYAATGGYVEGDEIGAEVGTPGSPGGSREVAPGGGVAETGAGDGADGGASEDGGGPPRHPGLTYEECVDLLERTPDRSACQLPVPGAPTPPAAPDAPPVFVIDPAVLAQEARESVRLPVPQPHTSPPEDGFQLVGLETWFWLDAADWRPVTARAELPGIWAEVTATPTRATWSPGDGRASVACDGPGARHPGTSGAATDCGHTYLDVGSYTIAVEVTFAVTWEASNGASGTQEPITVGAELPITVEQRQAVIDSD
jgi:hypothetical protein